MRRIKYIILFILLMPVLVNAKTYDINEKKLHITIDDSFYVFTRENLENNEDLVKADIEKEAITNLLTKNNAYLYALSQDKKTEIYLRVKKAKDVDNLKAYSDERLKSLAEDFAGKTRATKYDVIKNDYNFIYTKFKDANYDMINYYTIIKEEGHTYTMQKAGEFDEKDEEIMRNIVSSIKYDVKLVLPEEKKKDNSLFIFIIIATIFALLIVSYFLRLKKEREGFKSF